MALLTVFHSINSPENSPFSHSVLPVLLLPYWSVQMYISYESLPQPSYKPLLLTGLKATTKSPRARPLVGGEVTVYVSDINQPNLPTLFYSAVVSAIVFMALLTVFHSINSPDTPPHSHSVLPALFLPYWSFQLYVSLRKSPPALILSFVVDWASRANLLTSLCFCEKKEKEKVRKRESNICIK